MNNTWADKNPDVPHDQPGTQDGRVSSDVTPDADSLAFKLPRLCGEVAGSLEVISVMAATVSHDTVHEGDAPERSCILDKC